MSSLDHILLFTLLFLIFFLITRINQNVINKHFWKIVLFPILLYSLILGCRYGWGNDYIAYKSRMLHPNFNRSEDLGFEYLNTLINYIGINYVGGFIIYSLLYIIGAYMMIKDFRENKYMLSFFLPATLLQSTFTIRQSVGHSFVFIAIHFFHKKNWIMFIIMTLIAYSIHPASILILILYIPFYFFLHKPFKVIYIIPIYSAVSLSTEILSIQASDFLSTYLPLLSLDNKFDNYLQNDRWYSENAITEEWEQGPLTLTLSMLFNIGIIIITYISLKYRPKKSIITFYNVFAIGIIFQRIFWYFEIFRRISETFVLLYFVPLGYAVWIYKNNSISFTKKERLICKISIMAILLYLVLYYGRFILQSPEYKFVWEQL